jgi:hypothetical protein
MPFFVTVIALILYSIFGNRLRLRPLVVRHTGASCSVPSEGGVSVEAKKESPGKP